MQQRAILKNNGQTQNQRRKKRRSNGIILFVFICICACLIGLYIIINNKEEDVHYIPALSVNNRQTNNLSDSSMILTYEQAASISSGCLLLLNNKHSVPDNIPGELGKVTDYVWTLNNELLLNADVLAALKIMFESAIDAGHELFRVTEAYRTQEQQQLLYDLIEDKSLAALPGHSEHQIGFAVDISYHGGNITNSPQGEWLADNSYKFGFIMRYPQHKTHITGIPFEPWHYRFVGQPHAYFMYENDLVLEEYIGYLKKHREITIKFSGVEYRVHYLSNVGEVAEIPQGYAYFASLDNIGGVIMTLWFEKSIPRHRAGYGLY